MGTGVPHKRRRYAPRVLISAAAMVLLVGARRTVELGSREAPDLDRGDLPSEIDVPMQDRWAVDRLEVAPDTASTLRGELGPDETSSARVQTPVSSRTLEGAGTVPGGPFGLLADWHKAVLMPGPDGRSASLRGDKCRSPEMQAEVQDILRKAKATPKGNKVAICVRSKDSGRFLPEWIAFHYAVGVDEIVLFDDDSVDNTKEILQPFVDAGMVRYFFDKLDSNVNQMRPLNLCLNNHIKRRIKYGDEAPRWLVFVDVDEYIFPVDTSMTISQALMQRPNMCCNQVPRVQYGTSHYQQMPQGLLLETFLRHAHTNSTEDNRRPKAVVNMDPDEPSLGIITRYMKGMHDAQGCECELFPVSEIRINHYLGSAEDYAEKTTRFWKEHFSAKMVEAKLRARDVNDETSDTVTNWACATREILYRVVEGLDLDLGL